MIGAQASGRATVEHIDLGQPIQSIRFRYTSNRDTVHSIPVGFGSFVEVVGEPENGSYEWWIRHGDRIEKHSDCGYGCDDIALRDGLIAFHGLPGKAS